MFMVLAIITPEIDVFAIGPSMTYPYTSEQLRISGNNTPAGISKNLKKKYELCYNISIMF